MLEGSPRAALLVALGGALGCLARYAVSVPLSRAYPWGTLAVNVAGSFAIALLLFGLAPKGDFGADARALLVTGLLGGFTTMSSFAYETVLLAHEGHSWQAGAHVVMNVGGSVGAAFLARAIVA